MLGNHLLASQQAATSSPVVASTLYGWGEGTFRANMDSNYTSRSAPVAKEYSSTWTEIVPGVDHFLALKSDGTLWGWGSNRFGTLGGDHYASSMMPKKIIPSSLGPGSWNFTSAGASHRAAIDSNGFAHMWGLNTSGQLGDRTTGSKYQLTPLHPWKWSQIEIGLSHAVGIRSDGIRVGVGTNGTYLGYNSTSALTDWTAIYSISDLPWTTITTNQSHTAAIRSDGALFTWGFNGTGQLGDSTVVIKSSPVQIGTSSWTAVAAGSAHTIAIRTDGTLWAWGYNLYGQLGDGTTVNKSSPVQIGTSSWTAIAAGQFNVVAKRSDGALFTWGYNLYGQLGDGTTVSKSSPVQIGTSSWTVISAGHSYVTAIRSDGALFAWGRNESGQVGDGTVVTKSSPVQIGSSSWAAVAGGFQHTAAIRIDGTWWTWGRNLYGQLGDGTTVDKSSPVQIGTSTDWSRVSAGVYATTAIASIGMAYITGGLGGNGSYMVSPTTLNGTSSPVAIGGEQFTNITQGISHTVGLRTDNTLWAWGYNLSGRLGIGDATSRSVPTAVSAVIIDNWSWKTIASGSGADHSIALRSDGTLWAWGSGGFGQLGNSMVADSSSPVQIGTDSWTAIAAGYRHTAAVRYDGVLFMWGSNQAGQLGDGTTVDKSSPVQIGTSRWSAVAAGASHTIAIRSDGRLFAWGYNGIGELGDGTTIDKSSPVQIGTDSWIIVSGGWDHVTSLKKDGTLWTWGLNSYGQLGDGTTVNKSSPVQIGTNSWVALSATYHGGVAIRGDNTLWSWGYNSYGQLGDGTTIDKSSPVQVGSDYWSRLRSAGGYHVNAIHVTGSLWAWGRNDWGQLGDGTTINKSSPVQVGSSSWAAVGGGTGFTIGTTYDGSLFAWGLNSVGQLGDGTTISKSSPVLVHAFPTYTWTPYNSSTQNGALIRSDGALFLWGAYYGNGQLNPDLLQKSSPVQLGTSSWTMVSTGQFNTAAIRSDGALFAWGYNLHGQLGDGTTVNKSSPVQIGTSSWTAVSVGLHYMLAIKVGGTLWGWGLNSSGQLGDGTVALKSSPVQIGTSLWTSVTATDSTYSGGIRSGGSLFTWGTNTVGRLGDGTTVTKSSPVQIGTSSWTALYLGASHAVAIRSGGALFTWGFNGTGQLGDGTIVSKSSPVQIGTSSWVAVAAGVSHTVAKRLGGNLFAWGANNGQIGDNTATNRSSPVQIGSSSWVAVAAGQFNTYGTLSDGTVWAWGSAAAIGNLLALTNPRSSPVQIPVDKATTYLTKFIDAQASLSGGTAIGIDGTVWRWGAVNGVGYDPFGTYSESYSPVLIEAAEPTTGLLPMDPYTWSSVALSTSAGDGRITAIRSDGTIWTSEQYHHRSIVATARFGELNKLRVLGVDAKTSSSKVMNRGFIDNEGMLWVLGLNTTGQLGDGTTVNKSTLVQIGTSSWTMVSSSESHTVAIRSDGALFAWGRNNIGQLGDGTTVNKSSPVQIGTSSWTMVATSASNSCAVRSDGALFTWGYNLYGQLGDGTTINKSSPVQIGTSSWTVVSTTTYHTAAIRSDGRLFTWGWNAIGTLGDSSLTNRSSPVQIGTSSWTKVAAFGANSNYLKTHAIRSDGTLWAWGYNLNGQLGAGVVSQSAISSPIQVGTSNWNDIGGCELCTVAIRSDGTLWAWGRDQIVGTSTQPLINGRLPTSLPQLVNVGTVVKKFKKIVPVHGSSVGSADGLLMLSDRGAPYITGRGALRFLQSASASASWYDIQTQYAVPLFQDIGVRAAGVWSMVAAPGEHTVAIRSDGALFTWGRSQYGQLGDGTTVDKSSPVQIGTSSWTVVAKGYTPTCSIVIRSDGALFAWGRNNIGQLGDGTKINQSSPVQIGSSSWTAVAVGATHAVAIRSDGALFAWGYNFDGQLGDGTTVNKSSPVQIGTSSWTAIAAGSRHTVAIRSDGALFTWGYGLYGQLGDGTQINKSSPVQIGTSSWTVVSSGIESTAAIRSDGALFTWGYNVASQLGDGTTIDKSSPVQIGTYSWTAVEYGLYYAVALRSDGVLFAWGANNGYQLGKGDANNVKDPYPVGIKDVSWTAIAAGTSHTVAICSDGALFTWAQNNFGQLGNGTVNPRSLPTAVPYTVNRRLFYKDLSMNDVMAAAISDDGRLVVLSHNTSSVGDYMDHNQTDVGCLAHQITTDTNWKEVQVCSGGQHGIALKEDGTIWGWGVNAQGGVGNGSTINVISPVQVGSGYDSLAPSVLYNAALGGYSGTKYNAAIKNGEVYAWGPYFELAVPANVFTYNSPIQIGTSSWSKIGAGGYHSAAIRVDGTLFTWGYNLYGQLGNGQQNTLAATHYDTFTQSILTPVTAYYNTNNPASWLAVSSGGSSVAIRSDGTLWTWGFGGGGGLGDLNITYNRSSPIQIGVSSWSVISAGASNMAAIRSDGALFTWGTNPYGQLGDTTTDTKSSPVQIGSSSWTAISVGGSHMAAIRSDGALFTWGQGTSGQLGHNGTEGGKYSPTRIGMSSWSAVAAGASHTVAIRSDGALFAWGPNGGGQLGDSTVVTKSSPVQIGTSSWTKVAAGLSHTAAIRSDGALFTWGLNTFGQIGDSTGVTKSSPVQIGSSSWTAVAAGSAAQHTVAIRTDGALFTWGWNGYGQLGDGTTVNKSSPVQIGTSSWTAIAAGSSWTLAIRPDNVMFAWGASTTGALGHGSVGQSTNVLVPTAVIGMAGKETSFAVVSTGVGYHTQAVGGSGRLYSWGGFNTGVHPLGRSNFQDVRGIYNVPQEASTSGPKKSVNDSWTFI